MDSMESCWAFIVEAKVTSSSIPGFDCIEPQTEIHDNLKLGVPIDEADYTSKFLLTVTHFHF